MRLSSGYFFWAIPPPGTIFYKSYSGMGISFLASVLQSNHLALAELSFDILINRNWIMSRIMDDLRESSFTVPLES